MTISGTPSWHLDRMRVTQLMGRKPSTHAGGAAVRRSRVRRRRLAAVPRGAVDDAEQRAGGGTYGWPHQRSNWRGSLPYLPDAGGRRVEARGDRHGLGVCVVDQLSTVIAERFLSDARGQFHA